MRMALISEGVSQWAVTSAFLLVPEQLLYCYFQWLYHLATHSSSSAPHLSCTRKENQPPIGYLKGVSIIPSPCCLNPPQLL